jgi:hypothetical protein
MGNTKVVNGALVTEIPVDTSVTNDQLEQQSHKYEVGRIKTFRGMDGQGLNAVLIRNHKAVADILDEGCGGEMRFDWLDQKHGESAEEAMFEAFIAEEKLKIPADKKDPETDVLEREYFDGATWVNMEVDRIMNDRRFRKACKTKTLFQVGDKIGSDDFLAIKGVDLATRQYIEKKYKGQKIRILNDEYK